MWHVASTFWKMAHQATVMRKPNQPKNFRFPLRSFGNKGEKRSFQPSWFEKRPWLDYQETSDSVICLYCSSASKRKLLTESLYKKKENVYISDGFTNWKDATVRFNTHELSQFHIDSVKAVSQPRQDVAEMLSCAVTKEKEMNGSMLMMIFQNLQFLSRQ